MFGKKYKKIIIIEGMHCEHCAKKVTEALNSIEGVTKVKVNLFKKEATLTSKQELDNKTIKDSFNDSDFKITNIK